MSEAATPKLSRGRRLAINGLIGVATVLLVIGIFATWANRLLFNPDNFSKTSTALLQNANVRSTTANYVVDQLYANVDVAGAISSGLPPRLQPLAAPAAGALRDGAVRATESALNRPRVQHLWAQANRRAAEAFIAIVNGGKGPVGIDQGTVTLNLAPILEGIASRLGLPADLSAKLPPDVAHVTVLKSDQLKYVQTGGKLLKGLAVWLVIIVSLLYALALLLAVGARRRTLIVIGFSGVFAGVAVLVGRAVLESQIAGSLTADASLKATVRSVYVIVTSILADVAVAVLVGGLVLIAAGWLVGPARIAVSARRRSAPFLREHPVASRAIALAVVGLIFVWNPIPATGKPAGMIAFTVLALVATELLIRQTGREFPDARAGAVGEPRDASWRTRRAHSAQSRASSQSAATTTAAQLRQLVQLRDDGAITTAEYQTAKGQLLDGESAAP
ncbi:MAG TPA: SHOCT domain-containing protein [Solirubrobacteraceae bacterium]|nr:SHOCT domain-containing protein [Solirubrobacteraceae bacterium]